MKRWFFLILTCFLMTSAMADENILNVYTWAGYLPQSVIREFEQETGIRVNHSTYANNEVLYAKLKANPDAGYDVVIPSTYFISRMIKQGLLQKIDKSKIPNYHHVNPDFLHKEYDLENDYSIPYLWNSTGIVVNSKFHPVNHIQSWNDLWDPKYHNELLVLDDTREIFSMALLTLGYSINDRNPSHIRQAFEKLKSLMGNIKLFNLDAQRSIYLDEDITLGMGWSGDVFIASQENPNLQFVFPKEGFIVALDNVAIPKGAKHVQNAHRFIDFVLRAEIAKRISLETGFSTPNLAAMNLLPPHIRDNKVLYPDPHVLQRVHIVDDVGETAKMYEKYFERLKLE